MDFERVRRARRGVLRRTARMALCALVGLVATVGLSACSDGSGEARDGRVVASNAIVASIVDEILGGTDEVATIMPNGKDPHEFSPSARNVESIDHARLIVLNGAGLEAGLHDALGAIPAARVFALADHVTLRGDDPHLWLDPVTVRQAVPALGKALSEAVGRDLTSNVETFIARLDALDESIVDKLGALGGCDLVTDHDALVYFAARYGCDVVGSVVPGLSTAGESTANDVAELKTAIAGSGVRTIFTEPNSAGEVARALGRELGVDVVELNVERLPDGGGYEALITQLADAIVKGLAK